MKTQCLQKSFCMIANILQQKWLKLVDWTLTKSAIQFLRQNTQQAPDSSKVKSLKMSNHRNNLFIIWLISHTSCKWRMSKILSYIYHLNGVSFDWDAFKFRFVLIDSNLNTYQRFDIILGQEGAFAPKNI